MKYVYFVSYFDAEKGGLDFGFGNVEITLTHPVQSLSDTAILANECKKLGNHDNVVILFFQLLQTDPEENCETEQVIPRSYSEISTDKVLGICCSCQSTHPVVLSRQSPEGEADTFSQSPEVEDEDEDEDDAGGYLMDAHLVNREFNNWCKGEGTVPQKIVRP